MEKLFHLKENHTDVKTEVMAGITTLMTMASFLRSTPTFCLQPVWMQRQF